MKKPKHRNCFSRGFTLIEVIIVIAILAIVAGAMAPMAVRTIDGSRQEATLKRQQMIYQAIFGDPSAHGTGFLSDIGRIPGQDLTELAIQGSLPTYASQSCGASMGWRGPYLLEGVDKTGRPVDGWGEPMDFANGQIRSKGPDRILNNVTDNLYYPPAALTANNIYGGIVLEAVALDTSATPPTYVAAGGSATICYARNGAMQTLTSSSSEGAYTFPNIPQGIQTINVIGDPDGNGAQPALTRRIAIFCPAGGSIHKTVAMR
jgi:prepilin-type N-terminal cleavage/methylation domain-containing protein